MRDLNYRNALIYIVFSLLVAACASAPREQPTHYWQAEKAKTERDYRMDNGACHEQLGMDEANAMDHESTSFEAYSNCMIEKGYVLRSYH